MGFEMKVLRKLINEMKRDLEAIADMMMASSKIKNKRLYIRVSDFLVEEFMDNGKKLTQLSTYFKELKEEKKVAKGEDRE